MEGLIPNVVKKYMLIWNHQLTQADGNVDFRLSSKQCKQRKSNDSRLRKVYHQHVEAINQLCKQYITINLPVVAD